jgi:murein L,D-transpeptidase YafK
MATRYSCIGGRGQGLRPFVCAAAASAFLVASAPGEALPRYAWPTPDNAVELVRVVKSARRMDLMRGGEVVKSFRIALGGDPLGPKQREGDGRTPEGSYFLDWRKEDSVAHRSIHISYPSAEERQRARAAGVKPGGAIMIHGQWNGFGWAGWIMQHYDWTNGCIGLLNEDMDMLWDMLAWNTQIEILP